MAHTIFRMSQFKQMEIALKPGFHMITMITEKISSAIVAIIILWKPLSSGCSDCSDHSDNNR